MNCVDKIVLKRRPTCQEMLKLMVEFQHIDRIALRSEFDGYAWEDVYFDAEMEKDHNFDIYQYGMKIGSTNFKKWFSEETVEKHSVHKLLCLLLVDGYMIELHKED